MACRLPGQLRLPLIAGESQQLQQDSADGRLRTQAPLAVERRELVQPAQDAREILRLEMEVHVLLEQEGRELGMAVDGCVLQVERFHVELQPVKALVEVQDGIARPGRVRDHMHAIGQHEAQVADAAGPHRAADQLLRAAFHAHLDLEVLVPVGPGEHVARALEADVEVEMARALLHAVEARTRRAGQGRHHAILSGRGLCCSRPAFAQLRAAARARGPPE